MIPLILRLLINQSNTTNNPGPQLCWLRAGRGVEPPGGPHGRQRGPAPPPCLQPRRPHRWNRNPRPRPQKSFLDWSSGVLAGAGGSDFIGYIKLSSWAPAGLDSTSVAPWRRGAVAPNANTTNTTSYYDHYYY